MADYYCTIRSNYFKVTDSKKLEEIISMVGAELWKSKDNTGNPDGYFCFGIEGSQPIDTFSDSNNNEYELSEEIQKILPKGELCIIYEIGNENLSYLSAYATFITKEKVSIKNFKSVIEEEISAFNPAAKQNSTLEY